jgi:dolichol-phosphate mannosyltransferase
MQRVVRNSPDSNQVETCLVVAAYREFENLSQLLTELDLLLPRDVAIIVSDDTGVESENQIEKIVSNALGNSRNWQISFENSKSGRGSAVLRGFKLATETYPNSNFYAECDADGSHRPEDIAKLIVATPSDFLIGSRYLKESSIKGWPLSRRVASRILNYLIPKLLGINCTDVTNGLRRYSKKANKIIAEHVQVNTGFIFLSEQAMILAHRGVIPNELPITFVNRVHGKSSVGLSEVVNSLIGVFELYRMKKKMER